MAGRPLRRARMRNPTSAYHRSRGEAEYLLAEDSYRKAQALRRRGDASGSHDALIHAHRMAALAEADLLDGASPKAADAKRLAWWKAYAELDAEHRKVRNPRRRAPPWTEEQIYKEMANWDLVLQSNRVTPEKHAKEIKRLRTHLKRMATIEANRREAHKRRMMTRNPYIEKFIPPGGKGYQYVYSEEDVAKRHAKKAQRIEALKRKEARLRAAVKRDVAAGNDAALAVGLILATYERPGNPGSAKAGHYGVTGWECRHLSTDKRKAVIDYIGKSGVHQTKTVKEPYLVEALAAKARQCGKRKGSKLLPVSASAVNRYLDTFDVSAKDLRTFGANTEMQRELKRARAAGPDLSTLKPRDVKKTLKAEFTAALGVVASRLGHTTSVLRKQYLVSTVEPTYLETGAVVQTFT